MESKAPTGRDQDIAKLHSEINQAVNHRFLLTAASVTALAIIGKEMFPTAFLDVDEAVRSTPYYFAYALLLIVLYLQSVYIRKTIRSYSSYLIAKGWSSWESDWFHARHSDDPINASLVRNDKYSHEIVFLVLAIIAMLLGFHHLYVLLNYNVIQNIESEFSNAVVSAILLLLSLIINLSIFALSLCSVLLKDRRKRKEITLINAWHNLLDNCNDKTLK